MNRLDMKLVRDATVFLDGRVRRTPTEPSPALSERLGVPVTLKLECLQVTGSFKIRGAFFRLSRLSGEERRRGIATCSAGNHGKAVAYAAKRMGLEATVYVPRDVDEAKFKGMSRLGARVIRSDMPGYDDTLEWAEAQADAAGMTFVSAFDDEAVMAGNGGTLALEVLEQASDARAFVLPVGGGGLSAGFAFVAKEKLPDCAIVACQHEESPALAMSLERGEAVTRLPAVETVAGGIEGGIGAKCFAVVGPCVDRVALVSEREIVRAFLWMLEQHQYLVEPTAAVTVAACLSGKVGPLSSPAVVVLSGRNVGMKTIQKLLAE